MEERNEGESLKMEGNAALLGFCFRPSMFSQLFLSHSHLLIQRVEKTSPKYTI